ncbi:MAG: CRISPR system precrRNA processing endoribonuclease RAMP protein Cas6 [Deltaproteobacteria bacterium]|nr:CRISPR system precrRNA processing endoribonuclease RAMP protein Cas6 [Deltaproteobacteria bacterium]
MASSLHDQLLTSLSRLTAVKAEFTMRAQQSCQLPEFLGSTLRGALAGRLKRLACPAGEEGCCAGCLLGWCCPYGYLFETPRPAGAARLRSQLHLPHPLVIEPPPVRFWPWSAGEELSFSLLLFGRAAAHLPYLVAAAERLLLHGPQGQGGELVLVRVAGAAGPGGSELRWPAEGEQRPLQPPAGSPVLALAGEAVGWDVPPAERSDTVKVWLLTPLRLLEEGRRQEVTLRGLVKSLLGRVSSLLAFHCGAELDIDFKGAQQAAASAQLLEQQLSGWPLQRWSSRQQARIPQDGPVGHMVWQGEAVRELWPLLRAGEVIHAGKGTVMGLGRIAVEVPAAR